MYREFDDRTFCVFPGGGKEGNESEEECVTSEVNLTAFICAAYRIKPNSKLPFLIVSSCSPICFEINKENF